MDTDKQWDFKDEIFKEIENVPVHMIGSIPCFEGLLLDILQIAHHPSTEDSKQIFKKHFSKIAAKWSVEDYKKHYEESTLEESRARMRNSNERNLNELIKFFEGKQLKSKRIDSRD